MFYSMRKAIVCNLLYSVNSICYKKSMSFAKLSEILFTRLRETWGLPLSLILIAIVGFDTSVISWQVILGVLLIIGVCNSYQFLEQKLYREEKLSNILPYADLNSIFAIIAGFLIFRDASIWSFIIAILAFFVIMAFSIDLKKLALPKTIKLILAIQLLIALETLLTGWFLKSVSDTDYYILYEIIVVALLFIPLLRKRSFKELKKTKAPFYGYLMGGALTSHLWWILYLFTVSELWVVMSVLLSFLGTGITMLFGRIFLKEKPTRKNIIMAVIVASLVGVGFMIG